MNLILLFKLSYYSQSTQRYKIISEPDLYYSPKNCSRTFHATCFRIVILNVKKKAPGSVSPRTCEERKSPERKNFPNPFSFTHAKKATNDIIQNEILKNEILKRKTEEMNLKNGSSLLVN